MADTFLFELVAPESLIYSDQVEMVVVPGSEGEFGVLPGHSPLISAVRPGIVEIYEYPAIKSKARFFVAGGFAEVTNDRCAVLTEDAVPVEDLKRADLEQRIKDAEEALAATASDADRTLIEARLTTLRDLAQAA